MSWAAFPTAFNPTRGSVRWSGEIASDQAGVHNFRLYSSHFAKVWLDGKLVVDSWRQNWCPWTHFLQLQMEPGKRYAIKIEWIPNGGYIGLRCLTPHDPKDDDTMSLWSEVADQIDYYFIAGRDIDRGHRRLPHRDGQGPDDAQVGDGVLAVPGAVPERRSSCSTWSRSSANAGSRWTISSRTGSTGRRTSGATTSSTPDRYPDPDGMVKELHNDLNTHIMISVWPKFYVGTKNYEAMKDKGWLYMRNVEKGQRDWVGPGLRFDVLRSVQRGGSRAVLEADQRETLQQGFRRLVAGFDRAGHYSRICRWTSGGCAWARRRWDRRPVI